MSQGQRIDPSFRTRKGHASVEYAILLTLVTSLTAGFAIFADKAFEPIRSDVDQLTAALIAEELEAAPRKARDPVPDTVDAPGGMSSQEGYLLTAIALAGIGSIGLIRRRFHPHAGEGRSSEPVNGGAERRDGAERLREAIFEKRDLLLEEMTDEIATVMHGQFEVWHLMSTRMKTIAPDLPARAVRDMLAKHKLHHLLVTDGATLLGVVGDRDVTEKPDAKTAAGLMTTDPVTVSSKHSLVPTVSTMINKRIYCLPVVDDGILKGVLTRTDLLLALQCVLQIMSKFTKDAEC